MTGAVGMVDEEDRVDGGWPDDVDEVEPDPTPSTSRQAQWPDSGIRPDAAVAWRELSAALDAHRCTPLPCQMGGEAWFSPLSNARAVAVEGCLSCPVLQACDAFASANDEPTGIWGGRSRGGTRSKVSARSAA